MSMIRGSWGTTKVICGNHPNMENPPEMIIQSGAYSLFYACPLYDATKREEDEPPCYNRINLVDYEKMIDHITDIIMDAEERDEKPNLTNHKWTRKSIEYEVIQHDQNGIVVKMLNKQAIHGHLVR